MDEDLLNKLKQVALDIFKSFVLVCDQLHLRYYVIGGTLLGAIRHGGFIPWDDDIDVGMPRKDYERFLREGQALLPTYYFLQSIHTDAEYAANFAKIRDSRTTFIESSVRKLHINHGIYMDIFPLDYYPEEKQEQRLFDRRHRQLRVRIALTFEMPNRKKSLRMALGSALLKCRYPSVKKALFLRERLFQSVPQSSLLANHCGAWGKKEIVPFDWYGEGASVAFEGMSVSAPKEYDKWLTQVYGNYRQLPPPEKRMSHHFTEVIDTERPFTEYT